MTVTAEELAAMDAAAPLVGRTPRSVKRFVNVFQLVKAIGQAAGRSVGSPEPPVVLLALATGLPRTATALFDQLSAVPPPATLRDAAAQLPPDDHSELRAWLVEQPGLGGLATADLLGWLDLVRRFSFQPGAAGPAEG
ncbi:MAG TPA: hypothetical protein VM264_11000 [Acidimicrobiales bacterium]|nr:hypothetical protein [Acidimicrobiales bacterium]